MKPTLLLFITKPLILSQTPSTLTRRLRGLGLLSLLALSWLLSSLPTSTQAGLLISPTRVIFEGRDRATTVTLMNTGNETITYRIQFVENRQTPNLTYQMLDTKKDDMTGLFPAAEMLRYSPRQVTLAPNERQTVRLRLRKPTNLPIGEYRSHLAFYQLPKPTQLEQQGKNAGINLFMLVGFSIPIQVWQGNVNTRLTLSNLTLKQHTDKTLQLSVQLNRTGDFSAIGKLTAYWRAAKDQPYQEVGKLNNVAIYRETLEATAVIKLPENADQNGQYKVTFTPDKAYPQSLATEVMLTLP